MFKQDADYPFVDWSFAGTTEEEFATLMAIFNAEDKEVYIADYEHRVFTPAVFWCRACPISIRLKICGWQITAWVRTCVKRCWPCRSEWEKEDYLNLIAQLDDEGHDDFTRVRELLGLATGKDNGWYTLRIGELKAMLALAGGDLDQALARPSGPWNSTSQCSLPSAPTTTAACKPSCFLRRKRIVSHCST